MKFCYGDEVKVVSGFYTGVTGTVIGITEEKHKKLFKKTETLVYFHVEYKSCSKFILNSIDLRLFEEDLLEKL